MTFGNQPIELARRARGEELNEGKDIRKDRARAYARGYPLICSTVKERGEELKKDEGKGRQKEAATDRSIVDLDMLD